MSRRAAVAGIGETALAQSMRAALLGGRTALVSEAAIRANMLPDDAECSRLRQACLLGGFSLSWSIGQQGGVIWYATSIHHHVPQRVGTLADLLAFLDALAERAAPPAAGPIYYCHGKPRSPLRPAGRLAKQLDKLAGRK